MTWVKPNYFLTQILTGHGDFKSKLYDLNLVDESECLCGEEDTYKHFIFDCELFEEERRMLVSRCGEKNMTWPPKEEALVTKDIFPDFERFVGTALKIKEELN